MANNITNLLGGANYSYLFNNNTTKAQNSINSLWSNYGNFQSNTTANLGALAEIRQNASAVVDSYNEAKDTFYTEFDSNMSALKESAKALRNFDFSSVTAAPKTSAVVETSKAAETTAATTSETGTTTAATSETETTTAATSETETFAADTEGEEVAAATTGETTEETTATATTDTTTKTDATTEKTTAKTATVEEPITKTQEVDKNGKVTTKTTYSKAMQSALETVKSLVDNYNDSLKFLKANSEVSGRVSQMAANFGDTTYRSSLYESVGISVGKDGTLTIDEEKLANSIVDNPDKVSRILGGDGLAGKAEQHVNSANGQRNNLFPSAKAMLGDQMDAVALYTGKSMINMTNISNIGNLINMMF